MLICFRKLVKNLSENLENLFHGMSTKYSTRNYANLEKNYTRPKNCFCKVRDLRCVWQGPDYTSVNKNSLLQRTVVVLSHYTNLHRFQVFNGKHELLNKKQYREKILILTEKKKNWFLLNRKNIYKHCFK